MTATITGIAAGRNLIAATPVGGDFQLLDGMLIETGKARCVPSPFLASGALSQVLSGVRQANPCIGGNSAARYSQSIYPSRVAPAHLSCGVRGEDRDVGVVLRYQSFDPGAADAPFCSYAHCDAVAWCLRNCPEAGGSQ